VLFSDTQVHWSEGVQRLLDLDEARARRWVESVLGAASASFPECDALERIAALRHGTRAAFGLVEDGDMRLPERYVPFLILGRKVDRRWVLGVGDEPGVEVIGPADIEHGVLVDRATRQACRPPTYSEAYFEGGAAGYGYGTYSAQAGWRMEKARRYASRLSAVARFLERPTGPGTRLLDVGAGYGFFRVAASELGWSHDGQDVSEFAARAGQSLFGLRTFVGSLHEFAAQAAERYDIVTLFDSLEHSDDPQSLLSAVAGLLRPGGLAVVRTPNIRALEFEVFGRYYHSLKLEHLHYFSPASLCHVFERAGLLPKFLTTESHLLAGFLGSHLSSLRQQLRGSDLFAVASKP